MAGENIFENMPVALGAIVDRFFVELSDRRHFVREQDVLMLEDWRAARFEQCVGPWVWYASGDGESFVFDSPSREAVIALATRAIKGKFYPLREEKDCSFEFDIIEARQWLASIDPMVPDDMVGFADRRNAETIKLGVKDVR